MNKTKYPIYVISKNRVDVCYTAKFLANDNMDFKIVVEPQETQKYANKFGQDKILTLPFSNLGLGSIPARNWCWENAKKNGHFRHWILDDNIHFIYRTYKGKRIRCKSLPAFKCIEDFTDRYKNVAISGLNYSMFVAGGNPPFYLNTHVYSFLLIRNDLKYRWRGRYNEDTDLCLQVLSYKWCTVAFNAFCQNKQTTGTMKGGNADELYKGHGRLYMANALKRMWPGVVDVKRRYKRPQHVIAHSWRKFDHSLIKKKDYNVSHETNEYGLTLKEKSPIKSPHLKKLYDTYHSK